MTMIFGSKPITSESVYLFYYRRAKRILPLYLAIILIGKCFFPSFLFNFLLSLKYSGSLLVFIVYPSTFVPMNMDSAWNSIFLYHNMAEHSDNNLYFKMVSWLCFWENVFHSIETFKNYIFSAKPSRRYLHSYVVTMCRNAILSSRTNYLSVLVFLYNWIDAHCFLSHHHCDLTGKSFDGNGTSCIQ